MSIIIRNATKEDVATMLNIYKPYIEKTVVTFEYTVPSLKDFEERFFNITKQDAWIVCEIDKQIAGYAYSAPLFERAAFNWDTEFSIYLNENYHSKHIGTALYHCLLDIAKLQGYYNIYSLIESSNTPSIEMHKKFGFKEISVMNNIGFKHNAWRSLTWLLMQIHEYDNPKSRPIPITNFSDNTLNQIYNNYASIIKF